ncbi:MAG: hypothetical protein ACXU9D_16850 [Xanthobacteraceae bacterium]
MHTGTMFAQDNPADSGVPAQDREGAGSAKAGWRVCAFVLLLFIVAAALSAVRKDVTQGFDEVAHASYIAHLQHTGETWPAFARMRMLDPSSFRFTGEANYLNHPSPYYWLLARLGPGLEGHPQALLAHRLFNVALVALGLAALMAIGLAAGLPRLTLYAYIVPLACIPVLAPLAGAVNNDNAAFAGGAIATLAAFQLLGTGSRAWLLAALGGVIVASWAKFTGLLLAGGLIAGVLLWLLWRGRLPSRWIAPIAIAALLAGAPYLAFFAQYGSPTPRTPGEIAMIEAGSRTAGWDNAERLRPLAFAIHFVSEFVLEWMPTLKPRNAVNYIALAIPITAALCAFAGIAIAVRRIARGQESPLDIVIAAGALAFAATLVIHGIFGFRLHTEFGWLTTAYPRYYLPLAAILPLAGLALLDAVRSPSARAILLVFLIAGPVLFRLLGEPLG